MYRLIITVVLILQIAALSLLSYQILSTTILLSLPEIEWQLYELLELLAILALVCGTSMSMILLKTALISTRQLEDRLASVSSEFEKFITNKFDEWNLTASERDVSVFLLKGFRIREIAELRETTEGTVKAQISKIYKKAGLSGRGELTSYFLGEQTAGF